MHFGDAALGQVTEAQADGEIVAMINTDKTCPACAESIKVDALVCRYCGNKFDPKDVQEISDLKIAEAERIEADQKRGAIESWIDYHIVLTKALKSKDTNLQKIVDNYFNMSGIEWDKSVLILRGMSFDSDLLDHIQEYVRREGGHSDLNIQKSDYTDQKIMERVASLGMNFVQLTDEECAVGAKLRADRIDQEDRIRAQRTKQKYDSEKRRPFIVAGIAVVVVVIAAFTYFGGGRGQGAVGGDQQSATVGGSDGSDRERYERLSPEGKKYVDDQMRAYDEHCARDPNC